MVKSAAASDPTLQRLLGQALGLGRPRLQVRLRSLVTSAKVMRDRPGELFGRAVGV